MSVTAINAELEQQIAEQRQKAEAAMVLAKHMSNPGNRRYYRDKARHHYSMMAGLISKRSDERVEQMERERGLR